MTEPDKKNKVEEFETISNTVKLQKKVFAACEDLDGHAESIGEEIFNSMLAHHYEQYLREYEKMNAEKLLDVDKKIAEFNIRRDKELAEIKELQAKQAHELEELRKQREREFELEKAKTEKEFEIQKTKELGEIQLEHDRVRADIARRRQALAADVQVLADTLERELTVKMDRIMPGIKPRRRFFGIPIGKVNYNQAMEIVLEAAELSTYEYLSSHAEEVLTRKAKYFEKMGISQDELKGVLKFELEVSTERDKQYYLKALENEDYLERKAQRKAEKAERKRLKKEAKKANKSKGKETEPKPEEVQEKTEPSGQASETEEDKGG